MPPTLEMPLHRHPAACCVMSLHDCLRDEGLYLRIIYQEGCFWLHAWARNCFPNLVWDRHWLREECREIENRGVQNRDRDYTLTLQISTQFRIISKGTYQHPICLKTLQNVPYFRLRHTPLHGSTSSQKPMSVGSSETPRMPSSHPWRLFLALPVTLSLCRTRCHLEWCRHRPRMVTLIDLVWRAEKHLVCKYSLLDQKRAHHCCWPEKDHKRRVCKLLFKQSRISFMMLWGHYYSCHTNTRLQVDLVWTAPPL